jgi:hypothetical protein
MKLDFLFAFVATNLIEIPVLYALYRKQGFARVAIAALAMNSVSLPLLWFAFYPSIADYWAFFCVGEAFVFAFEAGALFLAFRGEGARKALLASLLANSLSAGAGLALSLL